MTGWIMTGWIITGFGWDKEIGWDGLARFFYDLPRLARLFSAINEFGWVGWERCISDLYISSVA